MKIELGTVRSERHGLYRDARVWRVAPAQPERRPWWKRLLRRKPEATTAHKLIALHIASSATRSALQ